MSKLRIFVSSTCYDLGIIRSELRPFITAMGYEPVMSDYSDILYDPRSHTHDNCIKEVPNCDMVLLIIGQRFGGTAIPTVVNNLNLEFLETSTSKPELLKNKDKLSITQIEVLKAVEQSIPVYAFVDSKVLHDHHVYEKNKDKDIIDSIDFPSIQKRETAKYIFEFINFLSHRVKNNSIASFSRLEDIKENLVNQWSQLFQLLLSENRNKLIESKRYADFSERIEDLKAVVLASITTPKLRDTARGAIQYRHLILFISSLNIADHRSLLISDKSWDEVLEGAGIVDIVQEEGNRRLRPVIYLIVNDGTFYTCRYPRRFLDDLKLDWGSFSQLDTDNREAISEALLEDRGNRRFTQVRHIERNFEEFMAEKKMQEELIDEDES